MFFSLVNINSYFRLSKVILTVPDYFNIFKVAYAGDYEKPLLRQTSTSIAKPGKHFLVSGATPASTLR